MTEEFLVAGRRGRVIWTVTERVVPSRWVIEGEISGRKSGIVTYTLSPRDNGTYFEREFVYSLPNFLLNLLDLFVIRRRIEANQNSGAAIEHRVAPAKGRVWKSQLDMRMEGFGGEAASTM